MYYPVDDNLRTESVTLSEFIRVMDILDKRRNMGHTQCATPVSPLVDKEKLIEGITDAGFYARLLDTTLSVEWLDEDFTAMLKDFQQTGLECRVSIKGDRYKIAFSGKLSNVELLNAFQIVARYHNYEVMMMKTYEDGSRYGEMLVR